MVEYKFGAPYDCVVKAVTGTVIVGLLALFAWISCLALSEGGLIGFTVLLSLITLYFLIVFLPYLFSPRGFILTTNGILIKRHLRSILIPYDEISDVRRVSWTWRAIRLGASGGLYGFFGLFRVKGLGRAWMYVTDRSKMIFIETKQGKKYIISPSDPQTFLERLKYLLEALDAASLRVPQNQHYSAHNKGQDT